MSLMPNARDGRSSPDATALALKRHKTKRAASDNIVWECGDWCFHRCELSKIEAMEQTQKSPSKWMVTGVEDGAGRTGGRNLRVYPLSFRNKWIAKAVLAQMEMYRALPFYEALNWPQIADWIYSLADKAMELPNDSPWTEVQAVLAPIEENRDVLLAWYSAAPKPWDFQTFWNRSHP